MADQKKPGKILGQSPGFIIFLLVLLGLMLWANFNRIASFWHF